MSTTFWIPALLSLGLGSIIGMERQWHRRLGDLKTNALVSLGACLFMLVTQNKDGYTEPVRMAAQIVVGVGFIGGGLLFKDGAFAKGVNTAATLWCCAAVGTLCGLGRWEEATLAALVIVGANSLLRKVAQYLDLKMGINDSLTDAVRYEFESEAASIDEVQEHVMEFLRQGGTEVRAISRVLLPNGRVALGVTAYYEHANYSDQIRQLMDAVRVKGIGAVSWTRL